tara:strand:+ start:59 stop:319 length:261 start_codon:yes stop_codon:yes gene_type:complete
MGKDLQQVMGESLDRPQVLDTRRRETQPQKKGTALAMHDLKPGDEGRIGGMRFIITEVDLHIDTSNMFRNINRVMATVQMEIFPDA